MSKCLGVRRDDGSEPDRVTGELPRERPSYADDAFPGLNDIATAKWPALEKVEDELIDRGSAGSMRSVARLER